MTLQVGEKAPDFSLPDQEGTIRRLRDYRGRWVVVYFYPQDDTPGCVKEACSVRDRLDDLAREGVTVFGISKDSVTSHRRFADKYGLHFPLLADSDRTTIVAYGAWQRKNLYGKPGWGTARMTFLIGPSGRIAKIWPKVTPEGHADEILQALSALRSK